MNEPMKEKTEVLKLQKICSLKSGRSRWKLVERMIKWSATDRSSCLQIFFNIDLLNILQKYLNEDSAQVFFCEFCKIFKKNFFVEELWQLLQLFSIFFSFFLQLKSREAKSGPSNLWPKHFRMMKFLNAPSWRLNRSAV